jgi:hypothetical protein
MHSNPFLMPASRRAMLRDSVTLTGGAFLAQLFPASLLRAAVPFPAQQQSAPPADPVAAFRAQMAANPIHPQTLADNLTLLSGLDGNVVVLNGPDGEFMVDTFVLPAWSKLKESPPYRFLREPFQRQSRTQTSGPRVACPTMLSSGAAFWKSAKVGGASKLE